MVKGASLNRGIEQWDEFDEASAMKTVMEYYRRVSPIISIRLHPEKTSEIDRFLKLHNEPPTSDNFQRWKAENPKWGQILVDGINSNTRSSMTIAAYHVRQIGMIDQAIVAALSGFEIAHNELVAGGDHTVIDAEYQAFILSCRRCLDQMTYSISATFKNECSSFREFGKWLDKQKNPIGIRDRLRETYDCHRHNFEGWLMGSGGTTRSVRDDLAHIRSVSGGQLNVSRAGIRYVAIDGPSRNEPIPLTELTNKLLVALFGCVNDMIAVLNDDLERKFGLGE